MIIRTGMPRLVPLSLLLAMLPALAQQPAPEVSDSVIRSTVREVLLDVVVRQKNQQLARKLKASDFIIKEDGVPQTIKTFRFVTGNETEPAPSGRSASSTPAARGDAPDSSVEKVEEPAFVSIVFEELT